MELKGPSLRHQVKTSPSVRFARPYGTSATLVETKPSLNLVVICSPAFPTTSYKMMDCNVNRGLFERSESLPPPARRPRLASAKATGSFDQVDFGRNRHKQKYFSKIDEKVQPADMIRVSKVTLDSLQAEAVESPADENPSTKPNSRFLGKNRKRKDKNKTKKTDEGETDSILRCENKLESIKKMLAKKRLTDTEDESTNVDFSRNSNHKTGKSETAKPTPLPLVNSNDESVCGNASTVISNCNTVNNKLLCTDCLCSSENLKDMSVPSSLCSDSSNYILHLKECPKLPNLEKDSPEADPMQVFDDSLQNLSKLNVYNPEKTKISFKDNGISLQDFISVEPSMDKVKDFNIPEEKRSYNGNNLITEKSYNIKKVSLATKFESPMKEPVNKIKIANILDIREENCKNFTQPLSNKISLASVEIIPPSVEIVPSSVEAPPVSGDVTHVSVEVTPFPLEIACASVEISPINQTVMKCEMGIDRIKNLLKSRKKTKKKSEETLNFEPQISNSPANTTLPFVSNSINIKEDSKKMDSNSESSCGLSDDEFVVFSNRTQDSFSEDTSADENEHEPLHRQTSECDSEDSFICFVDSPDDMHDSPLDTDYHTDETSDEEKDEETLIKCDESEEEADSDYSSCERESVDDLPKLKGCLKKIGLRECSPRTSNPSDDTKKVTFSTEPPKVHKIIAWKHAYHMARIGHWQNYARDAERFKQRITNTSLSLDWVLKREHRSKVFFQRFRPILMRQKREELEARRKEKEAKERELKLAEELEEKLAKEKENELQHDSIELKSELEEISDEKQNNILKLNEEICENNNMKCVKGTNNINDESLKPILNNNKSPGTFLDNSNNT